MKYISTLISISLSMTSLPLIARDTPIRVSGDTGAKGELLNDTLNTISYFSKIYHCDKIKSVETKMLMKDRIPRYASYRVKDENAIYERWDVNFCGKFVKFMIIFTLDPAGGTFISVQEYPKDAL